jgi:Flp pilus assembly protein TadB
MPPVADYLTWPLLLMAGPLAVVTVAVVLIAFVALTARRTATRRHCLAVLRQLTRFAGVLRGDR